MKIGTLSQALLYFCCIILLLKIIYINTILESYVTIIYQIDDPLENINYQVSV